MTVRDEAVAAQQFVMGTDWTTPTYLGRLLDAIPADVLARLAIERGGLEQVAWQYKTPSSHDRYLPYYAGEAGHANHTRLYQVIES